MSKACERLGNTLALIRPPLRSWEWIAEWMESRGVLNRKGGGVNPKRLKYLYGQLASDGKISPFDSEKARRLLLAKGPSDAEIEEILDRKIGPARLDRLRRKPGPKPSKPVSPAKGKPKI